MKISHKRSAREYYYEAFEEAKTNKKKFTCKECHKKFSSKQCLKEHKYKHSNIKPYGCVLCKKRFRHASQFTVHKQTHRDCNDFYWPVLAEMEKKLVSNFILNYTVVDEIKIPLISEPQEWVLPSLKALFSKSKN